MIAIKQSLRIRAGRVAKQHLSTEIRYRNLAARQPWLAWLYLSYIGQ